MSVTRTVLILGASNKPDRYAFLAQNALTKNGHKVVLVHPTLKEILGVPVVADLTQVKEKIDDITLYVGPDKSSAQKAEILSLKPKRIIFNPGTENAELFKEARAAGIEVLEACTLVMLSTGVY